jgi:tRNA G18 (ribose-2'-O)-methylase SpoU
MITSKDNAKLKLVRLLAGRASDRQKAGAILVEGTRLVAEARSAKCRFRFALLAENASAAARELSRQLTSEGVSVETSPAP